MVIRCSVCGKIMTDDKIGVYYGGGYYCKECIDGLVQKTNKEPSVEVAGDNIDRLMMDNYGKHIDNDQEAKSDDGKPILSLVPTEIIYEIEKVRSFAQKKYKDANSWKRVELERYHEALLRHTLAVWDDVAARDKESGLLHLSHIATNVAFILEMLKDKE